MNYNNPIFIMACSPRSGSTWLQRVITSTNNVMIWGESSVLHSPFGNLWTKPEGDFANKCDLTKFIEQGADMWMAVLNPYEDVAMKGMKTFFETVFADEAKKLGYERWGKKETLWNEQSIKFIEQSWEDAKIIFLTRRFEASYYSAFPDRTNKEWVPQGFTREADLDNFCRNWIAQTTTALSYINDNKHRIIKYENLFDSKRLKTNTRKLKGLLSWLEVGEPDKEKYSPLISCTRKEKGEKEYPICIVDWKTVISKYASIIKGLSKQLNYKNPFNQKEM